MMKSFVEESEEKMDMQSTIIPVYKTVKSPHVMTQEIRGIHNIGIKLDTLLFSRKR